MDPPQLRPWRWLPWRRPPTTAPVVLFALASFAETFSFSHLGAFTPLYLEQLGVPSEDVPLWTGLLTAATFVLGLPLAPLWGVWADRYSRKLIIVRSTVGEALIFLLFGLANAAWQLLAARALVGFILGNTGVMYAVLASMLPRAQLATAIGVVGAGGTLGMSIGPLVGGLLISHIGLSSLFVCDAAFCGLVAVLLILQFHERRDTARNDTSVLQLLRALPRNIIGTPRVSQLFLLYFSILLGGAAQMPFVPLLVEQVAPGEDLPLAIGTVMLVTGVLLAVSAPLLGRLAARQGAHRVLTAAMAGAAVATALQAAAPNLPILLGMRAASGLMLGGTGPLAVSMLALATPEDRRASVLNMTLFPAYFSFVFGGLIGSVAAGAGIRAVFVVAGGLQLAGAGAAAALGRGIPGR